MEAKNVNKESFNKLANHPLQTWEWGEFRALWGNEVLRTAFGQLTLHKIPYTTFKVGAFIKGPEPTGEMLTELKRIAREQNLLFIKMEPNMAQGDKEKAKNLLKSNRAVPGKTLFTPTTFWIDLTKKEDELLASFESKTRYNIRYATRQGVVVEEDNSPEAFKRYLELTNETAKRQNFFAHTKRYHELMWKTLHTDMVGAGEEPIARLLTAKYQGEIITTWILFVWKDLLYYPYGASTDKYKNVMANNLMMWEAIKLGKKLGLSTFDLWGREEGKGFTKFKEGYNPKIVEFLGTWDLVINPVFYWPFRLAEIARWSILKNLSKLGLTKGL